MDDTIKYLNFFWQFQDYNFQMIEPTSNFPSSEQISFKLTQTLIPSFGNSKGTLIPLQSSLEYTYSRISIQQMLQEDGSPLKSLQRIDPEAFGKNNSLKASSIKTAAESDFKNTPRATFRERVVSSKKNSRKTSLEKAGSFHLFEFDQQKTTIKASLIHSQPKKSMSEIRKKSKSAHRQSTVPNSLSDVRTLLRNNSRRNCEEDYILLDLKKSMHIQQIKLRADEERQRNYMKRILQNRMCSIHRLEDMTNSTPLWTSRKKYGRI